MKCVLYCLAFLMATPVLAQDEKAAVREVIDRLFTSMNTGDSALLRTCFVKDVTMVNLGRNKAGEPVLKREGSVDDFAKSIGTPHPEPYSEPIWNVDIKIDGDFAQAWCDYAFYVGKNFSHCGVDAFQLHKTKDGWKIFHLADTRRRTGCAVPEEIERKFR